MANSQETQEAQHSEAELDLLVEGALAAEDRLRTELEDYGRLHKSDVGGWRRREKARVEMVADHNAELGTGRMTAARHANSRTPRARAEAELKDRMEARKAQKGIRGSEVMSTLRPNSGPEDQAAWNASATLHTTEPSTLKRMFKVDVLFETDAIARMLVEKNGAYGNSAFDPLRIFSQADPTEQIRVRIDDKLSRLARGSGAGEDVVQDLIGYLILLRIADKRRGAAPSVDGSTEEVDVHPARRRCNVEVVENGMSCQNWAGENHPELCNYHERVRGAAPVRNPPNPEPGDTP